MDTQTNPLPPQHLGYKPPDLSGLDEDLVLALAAGDGELVYIAFNAIVENHVGAHRVKHCQDVAPFRQRRVRVAARREVVNARKRKYSGIQMIQNVHDAMNRQLCITA
jgi:hypothetical protein